MSVKIKDELIALNLISILLLVCILLLPDNPLRIIIGIPFVLFLPGYALIAALYPRKTGITATEKILWSIGLSIAIVPLLGLCLNLIPKGINLLSAIIILTSFIFIMSVIAWYRRRNFAEYERYSVSISLSSPLKWREQTALNKALLIGLVLAIVLAVGVIGYRITDPVPEERITEFYILNVEGNAYDYPVRLKVGEDAKVIVGITNLEHNEMIYRLNVTVDEELYTMISGIKLGHDKTKHLEITLNFSEVGDSQKVEFALYYADETKPLFTPLHLWIDVME